MYGATMKNREDTYKFFWGTLQIETENNNRSEWKFAFWKYVLEQTELSQWYTWQTDCF